MNPLARIFALALALFSAHALAGEAGQWEPSRLKTQTIQAIHRQVAEYQACIDQAGRALAVREEDSRLLANEALKQCEGRLAALRETFIREGVSAQEADRYLRKTRMVAARGVLRALMSIEAQRASP